MKGNIFLVLLLLFLAGCKSSSEINVLSGHEYVPLDSGQYVNMEVITSVYAANRVAYSTLKFIKIQTAGTFTNTDGVKSYQVKYLSELKNDQWITDSTQAFWHTIDKVFKTEGGNIIQLMALPLSENSMWNGNNYNSNAPQSFRVKNLGKSFTSNNQLFPNTVTIVRQNDSTLIRQHKLVEVYAEGIGLIYKENVKVNFCYSSDCYGKGLIQSGTTEVSTIKSYRIP